MSQYDTLVYIGRFQPVHNAHQVILERALGLANQVIVLVGSAYLPRTYKNPFTEEERKNMIALSTSSNRIHYESLRDKYNNDAWAIGVQEAVAKVTKPGDRIGIIGHKKDESSFYLDMFPQWEQHDVELIEPLNATNIRDLYFRRDVNMNFIKNVVPREVFKFLQVFRTTPEWEQVIREREFVENYKKQFSLLPWEPTFVTTDAIVVQSGHVLLIERKAEPGRGLWALPGGFLNARTDASLEDCMIRELREETGLKVPDPVLRGSIGKKHVFDSRDRSTRGRTITHAFKIELKDGPLPKVKGGDDASKAKWVPVGELDSRMCYEDHYEIIKHFIGS